MVPAELCLFPVQRSLCEQRTPPHAGAGSGLLLQAQPGHSGRCAGSCSVLCPLFCFFPARNKQAGEQCCAGTPRFLRERRVRAASAAEPLCALPEESSPPGHPAGGFGKKKKNNKNCDLSSIPPKSVWIPGVRAGTHRCFREGSESADGAFGLRDLQSGGNTRGERLVPTAPLKKSINFVHLWNGLHTNYP